MKRVSFGDRLTPVLLTACLVFGIVVALQWYALFQQDGSTAENAAEPVAAPGVELTRTEYLRPDFAAFSEILERPLFTEGRTLPEQPVAEQASASPVTPAQLAMRLEGIALTPGARIAVVRDIPTNKLLRLEEGDKHQGWVVERIDATSATLKQGERTYQLVLELDEKGPRSGSSSSRTGRRTR